jgi:hypothetical protein
MNITKTIYTRCNTYALTRPRLRYPNIFMELTQNPLLLAFGGRHSHRLLQQRLPWSKSSPSLRTGLQHTFRAVTNRIQRRCTHYICA